MIGVTVTTGSVIGRARTAPHTVDRVTAEVTTTRAESRATVVPPYGGQVGDVPLHVLDAFDLSDDAVERLAGGRSPAYRVDRTVLKTVDDPEEAKFAAAVMASVVVDPTKVRIARPVRSTAGEWVVDGWTASQYEAGAHLDGAHPWATALAAIEALSDGLRSVAAARPGPRRHRWAVADRVAWDEEVIELHPRIDALCSALREMAAECESQPQLVHGDLAGNLLFQEGLPPVVIDFSPYVRPAEYAVAVYVVDALGWHSASEDLLRLVRDDSPLRACLPRAAIFRLVALDGYRREDGADIVPHLPAYERVCRVIEATLNRGP